MTGEGEFSIAMRFVSGVSPTRLDSFRAGVAEGREGVAFSGRVGLADADADAKVENDSEGSGIPVSISLTGLGLLPRSMDFILPKRDRGLRTVTAGEVTLGTAAAATLLVVTDCLSPLRFGLDGDLAREPAGVFAIAVRAMDAFVGVMREARLDCDRSSPW